jgi:hypothetical protein
MSDPGAVSTRANSSTFQLLWADFLITPAAEIIFTIIYKSLNQSLRIPLITHTLLGTPFRGTSTCYYSLYFLLVSLALLSISVSVSLALLLLITLSTATSSSSPLSPSF